MKLARAREKELPAIIPGDRIVTASGRKWRVVRVSGSTVTAEPIPTTLEWIRGLFGSMWAVAQWATRREQKVGELRAGKRRRKK